jgi:uncharacterized protein with HEPN domain
MLLDSDHTRLSHMIEAAQEAAGYVENLSRDEFDSQRPIQHSVVRCIQVIGEAASRLSPELRNAHPDIPWQDIIGMRNRLVHAYFDLDLDLIWATASQELPAIIPRLTALLMSR